MFAPFCLPLGVYFLAGRLLGPRWMATGSTPIPILTSPRPSQSTPVRHPLRRFPPSSPVASILAKKMMMATTFTKLTHTRSQASMVPSAATLKSPPSHCHRQSRPLVLRLSLVVHHFLLLPFTLKYPASDRQHSVTAQASRRSGRPRPSLRLGKWLSTDAAD